jgi:hypothetical protein
LLDIWHINFFVHIKTKLQTLLYTIMLFRYLFIHTYLFNKSSLYQYKKNNNDQFTLYQYKKNNNHQYEQYYQESKNMKLHPLYKSKYELEDCVNY